MSSENEQEITGIYSLREFLSIKIPPEPVESTYNYGYSVGYSDGYSRALQDLAATHRMGYSRSMHALHVLTTFWSRVLYPWRVRARGANAVEERPPSIKIEKWHEITRKVFERDNYTCFYCGKSKEKDGVQIVCDHVEPVVVGGGNEFGNLVAACKECNRAKGAKPIETFSRRAYLKWVGIDIE
jgi:hypothetical protein